MEKISRPGADLCRDSRIYGYLPGELVPIGPKVPTKFSHARDRHAVFLSVTAEKLLKQADIPPFQLDLAIRLAAYAETHNALLKVVPKEKP